MIHTLAPWLSSLVIASLKGSIILIAALVTVRAMRRSSAEARHAVLAIALIAFLVIPVATLVAPPWTVTALPKVPAPLASAFHEMSSGGRTDGGTARATSGTPTDQLLTDGSASPATERSTTGAAVPLTKTDDPSSTSSVMVPDAAESSAAGRLLSPASTDPFGLPPLRSMLLGLWLVGASLVALRLLVGMARLRILSRRATMVTDGAWLQTAHAIARQLGLTRGVTLLRGDREAVPMTWGVLSPVVWLPPAADGWGHELRSSVLSHELAHVRRRDALTQWLANLAVALHWFNPLVWMATRALRAERERACDDAVLSLGAAPDDYAEHLLDMVRALGVKSGPAPAMAMARRSQFEGRLLAILDRACSRAPVGSARLAVASAGALALVLVLGGMRSSDAARPPQLPGAVARHADTPITATEALAGRAPRGSAPGARPASRIDPALRPGVRATAPVLPQAEMSGKLRVADAPSMAPSAVRSATGDAPRAPGDSAKGLGGAGNNVVAEANSPLSVPQAFVAASLPGGPAGGRQETFSVARTDTTLLLEVIAAAEGISSSTDRSTVLERVASIPNLAPVVVTALGRAAGRVTSSTSRAKLLKTIIRNQPQASAASRRAVLDAADGGMGSEDIGSVLELFITRDSVDDAALADAFTQVAKISSSSEKARVLVAAARRRRPSGAARAAYVKAASTISMGSDRARVLSALLDEPPQDAGSTNR